jgi:hypothetical protein
MVCVPANTGDRVKLAAALVRFDVAVASIGVIVGMPAFGPELGVTTFQVV